MAEDADNIVKAAPRPGYLRKQDIAILANLCHHAIVDPDNSFSEVATVRAIRRELLNAAPDLKDHYPST